jgi:anti-sigma B factor antagonist
MCPLALLDTLRRCVHYASYPVHFFIPQAKGPMNIESENLNDDVRKISLAGRFDIEGAQQIDLRFTGLTANQKAVVVDLAGVNFLASIGIRTLVLAAKAIAQRGGKMVLLNPDDNVTKVLEMAGIDTLIPISRSLEDALSAVRA